MPASFTDRFFVMKNVKIKELNAPSILTNKTEVIFFRNKNFSLINDMVMKIFIIFFVKIIYSMLNTFIFANDVIMI